MKEKIKNIIIVMLVAGFTSITVSAATLMKSKDVIYDNKNTGMSATDVQSAVDELYSAATDYSSLASRVTVLESNSFLNAHPIGSIYLTISEDENTIEKMHNLYGGTWESYGQGRTLVGVGTGTDSNGTVKVFSKNESAGEYNHTLTISEMPNHKHSYSGTTSSNGEHSHTLYSATGLELRSMDGIVQAQTTNGLERGLTTRPLEFGSSEGLAYTSTQSSHTHTFSGTTTSTGSGESFSSESPYTTVYMYKRVN